MNLEIFGIRLPDSSEEPRHLLVYSDGTVVDESDECKEYYAVEIKTFEESILEKYTPVCPFGFIDCCLDPAYIKYHHWCWYFALYGDMTPEEAVKTSDCYEAYKLGECENYTIEDFNKEPS